MPSNIRPEKIKNFDRQPQREIREQFEIVKTEIEALDLGLVAGTSVRSFGAIGNGVTDDTAAIQAALNAGRGPVQLEYGKTYRITSTLVVPSNSGIIGAYGGLMPTVYMPAASFSNASGDVADRYGTNAVGIKCTGLTSSPFTPARNVVFQGFKLESEVSVGRRLVGIYIANVTDFNVSNVEIFGFPIGKGVAVASSSRFSVSDCYIHDFTESTTTAGSGQLTGIEIDNDIINSTASTDFHINNNRIKDLTVSGAFLTDYGYQTDGINLVGYGTNRFSINNNLIENVGEGIDTFASYGSFVGNVINDTYQFGIKLIHGASFNSFNGGVVRRAGLGGIIINSSELNSDVAFNTFSGIVVDNIDPNNVWTASDTYCIRFTGTGTYRPRNNLVTGCVLRQGAATDHCWIDTSTGSSNIGEGNFHIAGAGSSRRVFVTAGGGSARLAGTTTYETNLT